jgi:hypothetical protein
LWLFYKAIPLSDSHGEKRIDRALGDDRLHDRTTGLPRSAVPPPRR